MHSPHEDHLNAVYKFLGNLKQTPEKGLLFKKSGNLCVEAFTDADWPESIDDRTSTWLHICRIKSYNWKSSRK